MAFKRAFLWSLFCVMVFSTPGFSAITSKEYVDTHVKNQVSSLATKDELNTGLAGKQAVGDYALRADLPTKTSKLTNDSGFITSAALNDYAKLIDIPSVPTKVSELTNDSGYITNSALSGYATTSAMNSALSGKQDALTAAQQNAVNSGITAAKVSTYDGYAAQIAGKQAAGNYALKSEIPTVPTAVSAFTNDAGYVKSSELPTVPTKTSQLTNDSGFITASEVTLPDMSNYATKADLNTKVDTGAVTQTLQGTYTVSGKFYVPTPALPTE